PTSRRTTTAARPPPTWRRKAAIAPRSNCFAKMLPENGRTLRQAGDHAALGRRGAGAVPDLARLVDAGSAEEPARPARRTVQRAQIDRPDDRAAVAFSPCVAHRSSAAGAARVDAALAAPRRPCHPLPALCL